MNHPEFSNIEIRDFFMAIYALFLASLENRAGVIFRGERVFEEKSKIFLQKHARPNRLFQRAIFERSEKEPVNRHWGLKKSQIFCVRKFGMIHV